MTPTAPASIPCPICTESLRFTVCTNRHGKHSIGLHCPQDGRHFRGFVNHRPFVEDAISHMAAAEEARQARGDGAPEKDALQNHSEGPAASTVTKKPGWSK